MRTIELPNEYALVLQHVDASGEEDFGGLSETLHLSRQRIAHILQALQHKGLIVVSHTTGSDIWVRLSSKGRRLMRSIWPEPMQAGI